MAETSHAFVYKGGDMAAYRLILGHAVNNCGRRWDRSQIV